LRNGVEIVVFNNTSQTPWETEKIIEWVEKGERRKIMDYSW